MLWFLKEGKVLQAEEFKCKRKCNMRIRNACVLRNLFVALMTEFLSYVNINT